VRRAGGERAVDDGDAARDQARRRPESRGRVGPEHAAHAADELRGAAAARKERADDGAAAAGAGRGDDERARRVAERVDAATDGARPAERLGEARRAEDGREERRGGPRVRARVISALVATRPLPSVDTSFAWGSCPSANLLWDRSSCTRTCLQREGRSRS